MPIEYSLEKDGALVMARATGVISVKDFKDFQNTLRADVNLQDRYDTLLDGRMATQINLLEDELNTLVQRLTSGSRTIGANRLAIVSTKEEAFRLGNIYKELEKGVKASVIVFASLSTARIWLGID